MNRFIGQLNVQFAGFIRSNKLGYASNQILTYINKISEMKIFFNFFLCLIISSLSLSQKKTFTIETDGSVKTIHNHKPLWGENKILELAFVLKIGGFEETNDNYIFSTISDANIDKQGNYYIVDAKDNRIQIYDSYGKYLKTIGCAGQGPGEFNQPSKINFDRNGNLIVLETRSRRVQKIPLEYENMDKIQIFNMKSTYLNLLSLRNNNYVINTLDLSRTGGMEESSKKRIIIADQNLNELAEFSDFKMYEDFDKNLKHWAYILGNMTVITVDSFDHIFIAYQSENKIEKYTQEGKLLVKFDRDLPFTTEVTFFSDKWTKKNIQFAYTSVNIGIDYKDRLWINSYFEKPIPPYGGVVGNCIPEKLHLELYDNDGYLLCTMNPFNDYVMLRVVNDKVLFRDKDKICLYVYRIIDH